MNWQPSRRNFIKATAATAGAGILTACGSTPQPASPSSQAKIVQPKHTYPARSGDNVLRGHRVGRARVGRLAAPRPQCMPRSR